MEKQTSPNGDMNITLQAGRFPLQKGIFNFAQQRNVVLQRRDYPSFDRLILE